MIWNADVSILLDVRIIKSHTCEEMEDLTPFMSSLITATFEGKTENLLTIVLGTDTLLAENLFIQVMWIDKYV